MYLLSIRLQRGLDHFVGGLSEFRPERQIVSLMVNLLDELTYQASGSGSDEVRAS